MYVALSPKRNRDHRIEDFVPLEPTLPLGRTFWRKDFRKSFGERKKRINWQLCLGSSLAFFLNLILISFRFPLSELKFTFASQRLASRVWIMQINNVNKAVGER